MEQNYIILMGRKINKQKSTKRQNTNNSETTTYKNEKQYNIVPRGTILYYFNGSLFLLQILQFNLFETKIHANKKKAIYLNKPKERLYPMEKLH